MSKTITDNEFIYYFQENCSENIALQIDYSFKEIGFISIFKSAYIKHKGKIPTDKLLRICPIFDAKDAVEFHAFICKFCEIKRGFFVQERFDKVIKKIIEKSNKSKASITARWNKGKTLKGDTNDYTNVSTNDYTKDKVKVKVKVKDIIINNNIDKKEIEIPEFIDAELWNEFLKTRDKSKKAVNSDLAIKKLINKINKFHEKGLSVNEILESSVISGWSDVYEPKNNNNSIKKYGCNF
tara:strand:+ start:577 stop:1293 length:717 start_codon:yes stop_codon:yes gene_type:complete